MWCNLFCKILAQKFPQNWSFFVLISQSKITPTFLFICLQTSYEAQHTLKNSTRKSKSFLKYFKKIGVLCSKKWHFLANKRK